MKCQRFFQKQRIIRNKFDPYIIVRKKICNITFYSYEISNPIVNNIIFFKAK